MVSRGGVVFTKPWVVSMMLRISGYTSDLDLASYRVLEPSCGDGAFLTIIVDELCKSAKKHNHQFSDLSDSITAYDLDPKKVMVSREKAKTVLIRNGCSPEEAAILSKNWISTGDFLLSKTNGLFDLVIGNPPYIKSSDMDPSLRQLYVSELETMTMGTDIFVGFIEKGLKLLKTDGKLCYICADRWMQNAYGRKLRKYILSNHHMDLICRMHEVDAFEESVDAYPAIVLINDSKVETVFVDCKPTFGSNDVELLIDNIDTTSVWNYSAFDICSIPNMDCTGGPWCLSDADSLRMISKLIDNYPSLEDTGVSIGIGVATGRDEVFVVDRPGVVESERQLPLLCNRDALGRVPPSEPKHWLINPWEPDGTLIELDDYPLTADYFNSNSESLTSRHIAKKNIGQWYRTIDKVSMELAGKPKLLFSDLSASSEPMYDEGRYYPHHNLYWCTSDRWDLRALGGFLMSEQIEKIIDAYCVKMRGGTMRFQAQYLRKIHLPEPESISEGNLNELASAFSIRDRTAASEIVANIIEV